MSKFYVAARLADADKARLIMDKLEALGHEITHDWTVHIKEWADLRNKQVSDDELKAHKEKCGENDLDGVCCADALIWLYHEDSRGAFVEFGAALARSLPVYVLKTAPFYYSDTIFLFVDGVRIFRSDDEMFKKALLFQP